MNKILGIITARGGSKSIPGKNIKRLAGKPLIAWTIEAARQSHVLERVIVSTDDERIAAVSRKWGAEVPFLRPKKLAKDDTPTLPVLKHAVSFLKSNEGYIPDVIVLLQPTSPLRNAKHIRQAVSLFQKTKADSVVSVCIAKQNPHWMMRLKGNRVHPFMTNGKEYERRQNLPSAHYVNGAIYVTRYPVLMEKNKILGHDTRALVMDAESSIDIDTSLDFKVAEALMKERRVAHR
jgi:N-acylneuraminate cytidylyltransferase/CMP-N,N'-diacetyllegionaminic acid synthase